jgi:hypothetical protein
MLQESIIINHYKNSRRYILYKNNDRESSNYKNNSKTETLPQSMAKNDGEELLLQYQNYRDKIFDLSDFNEAFELVKSTVESKFKMHRAGLSLILQGLPTILGAYHIMGSNLIIVNKRILNIIKKYKSQEEYNSYLFMVLAHEYLHSLGVIDELQVRKMTYDLISSLVGEDHIAARMARYQPWDLFPELRYFQNNSFEQKFEIIKNFDNTNQSYIG